MEKKGELLQRRSKERLPGMRSLRVIRKGIIARIIIFTNETMINYGLLQPVVTVFYDGKTG